MCLLQTNQTLLLGNRPCRQFSTTACSTTGSILAQRELGHFSNITLWSIGYRRAALSLLHTAVLLVRDVSSELWMARTWKRLLVMYMRISSSVSNIGLRWDVGGRPEAEYFGSFLQSSLILFMQINVYIHAVPEPSWGPTKTLHRSLSVWRCSPQFGWGNDS